VFDHDKDQYKNGMSERDTLQKQTIIYTVN